MEHPASRNGEANGPVDLARLELLSAFFRQNGDEVRRALQQADAEFERTGDMPDLALHFPESSWRMLQDLAARMGMTDEQMLNEVLFLFQAIDYDMNKPAHDEDAEIPHKPDLESITQLLREPKLRSFFSDGLRQMHEKEKTGKMPPDYLLELPLIPDDIAKRAQQVLCLPDPDDALTDLLRLKYDLQYKD